MFIRSVFLPTIICYLCISSSIVAKETKEDIAMFTLAQVPYGYNSETGKTTGFLYDILNEIMRESGVGQFNVIAPPKRIFSYVFRNKKVCSLLAGTPDVLSWFKAVEPIDYEIKVGVLPQKNVQVLNYVGLDGFSVAVPYGVEFDHQFENDESIDKVYPKRYSAGVRLLNAGRVDAIAGSISSILYNARIEGIPLSQFGTPLIFGTYNFNLFCTNNIEEETLKNLQQAILTLKSRGKIKRILSQYFD